MLLEKYTVLFENYCDCEDCHHTTRCYPSTDILECDIVEVMQHMAISKNDSSYSVISVKDKNGYELTKSRLVELFESFLLTANNILETVKN